MLVKKRHSLVVLERCTSLGSWLATMEAVRVSCTSTDIGRYRAETGTFCVNVKTTTATAIATPTPRDMGIYKKSLTLLSPSALVAYFCRNLGATK